MPTDIYKLWFSQPGTNTADYPLKDMERFNAIESNILEVYTIFGNGVATDRSSKWEIDKSTVGQVGGNPRIYVLPGIGHVYWKVAETTANTAIDLTIPPGIDLTAGLQYHLYGMQTETTHYDRSINFVPYTTPQSDPTFIFLCKFTLAIDDKGVYSITSVDYSDRDEISIFSTLTRLINQHVHLGGSNPPKINLPLHTSGKLPGDFIDASLNANQITKGTLSKDRLPQIPHASLANAGDLSHPQIDSLLAAVNLDAYGHLSDISTTNQLRTLIALKSVYLSIDRLLLNTWLYVPGVTDTTKYVDQAYTTATIDADNHRIVGIMADPTRSDYVTWSGGDEFQAAIDAYDLLVSDYPDVAADPRDTVKRSENVVVIGDPIYDSQSLAGLSGLFTVLPVTSAGSGIGGVVSVLAPVAGTSLQSLPVRLRVLPVVLPSPGVLEIDTPLNFKAIHSRTGAGSLPWETPPPKVVVSQPPAGNTITVSGTITFYTLQRFRASGVATSQDWSRDNQLQFGIELVDPNILEHGDIKFHLIGAAHETLPSETLTYTPAGGSAVTLSLSGGVEILASDEQTAAAANNVRVVTVDLLQFPDRSGVQGFGFSVSSTDGWKLDSFDFILHQPPYDVMTTPVKNYLRQADPYSVGSEGNVTTYVYNDLYRDDSGFIIFRMAQPLPVQWNSVYWTATMPPVPSNVLPPRLTVRTRSAATKSLLPYTSWRLVPESTHLIQSDPNECLDIIFDLLASSDGRYSPILTAATLHYTMSSEDQFKTWTSTAEFMDSLLMQNIAIAAGGDAIQLADSDLVNGLVFLEGNAVNVVDADKVIMSERVIDGSHLYVSPRQVFAKQSSGFRSPRGLAILPNGNLLIADTRNDRVVEVDQDGDLYRGIQGNVYLSDGVRDFVVLSAIYNSRLGVLYVAFSQHLSSDIDRTKFTLGTVDGTNSFNFLTDTDGIFTTLADPHGETAVLIITLGAGRKQQVDYWTGKKKLTIVKGGVTGKAGTNADFSTTSSTTSPTTVTDPIIIFDSKMGTLKTTATGIAPPTTVVTDETTTMDFNGDDKIDASNLMDPDGNVTIATVLVDDADVVYANIAYPLSGQAVGDNNYVIAAAYDPSITNIGMDGKTVWTLPKAIVEYNSQKLGVATLLSGGTVLCASPPLGRVMEIVPSTQAIIYSYTPKYSPYYAVRTAEGNTIIVEVDEVNGGLNSRVFEVDPSNDVIREWGLGRLDDPTGVTLLSNGNWLITC